MGHSPGEWTTTGQRCPGGDHAIKDATGANVAFTAILGDRERQEANANLIAAAPKLLEALKDLRSCVTANPGRPVSIEYALAATRAAISKAEGK